MKITEAWKNRDEVIIKCEKENACKNQFEKLKNAITQQHFENVLLANFSWCVFHCTNRFWHLLHKKGKVGTS